MHFNLSLSFSPRLCLPWALHWCHPSLFSCPYNTPICTAPAGKKDSLAMDLWGLIPLDWSALTEALRSVISGVGSGVSRCS